MSSDRSSSPRGNRNYHACNWVQVATADGLRLDGLLHDPDWDATVKAEPRPGAVVMLVHGAGANFYGPSLVNRVGTHLLRAGWPVLRTNNRGHDGWHVAFRGGRMVPMGAAFEKLDEAVWDLDAWLGWLHRNGYSQVILIGHSLGALKLLLTLTEGRRQSRVSTETLEPAAKVNKRPTWEQVIQAVAISPPCLSESLFRSADQGPQFATTVEWCQRQVEAGQGDDIFMATYPFPMRISPSCYLGKYASGERFNFNHWLDDLPLPVQWIYGGGEIESHEALAAGVKNLELNLPTKHQLVTIPDADHFFTGSSHEVCAAVQQWLERT